MARRDITLEMARAAKVQARRLFSGSLDVVGIGIVGGVGGYALKVNVARIGAPNELPKEVDGVPVVVEVTGAIQKLPA